MSKSDTVFCNPQAVSREEQHKMMQVMGKSCQEKEGASDSDFSELIDHALPTTKPGKCLRACMMESIGLVISALYYNMYT